MASQTVRVAKRESVIMTVAHFQDDCKRLVKHIDSMTPDECKEFNIFLDKYPYAQISTIRIVALSSEFPTRLFPDASSLHDLAAFVSLAAAIAD